MEKPDDPKFPKIGCAIFIGVSALIGIFQECFQEKESDKKPDPEPKMLSAEEQRKKQIERQFSLWDGSHNNLKEFVKDFMHNPKSFEHVQSGYIDHGDFIHVEMIYRGENVFGGIVTNTVIARVNLEGEVIKIVDGL